MSEIVHPPIDLDLMSANSEEQNFAQSAALLLLDNYVERDENINGRWATSQLTERVDMESSTEGSLVSMRLRSLPVNASRSLDIMSSNSIDMSDFESTPDFVVIALEHATIDRDILETAEDDELPWQPYVFAIIDAYNPENAQVIDGKTGRDLKPVDLQMARILLNKLSEELSDARCEETDLVRFLGLSYRPEPTVRERAEFDPAKYIDTEECGQVCTNKHISCAHSIFSDN